MIMMMMNHSRKRLSVVDLNSKLLEGKSTHWIFLDKSTHLLFFFPLAFVVKVLVQMPDEFSMARIMTTPTWMWKGRTY